MGSRVFRCDENLDRLIDECLDLRVRISLRMDNYDGKGDGNDAVLGAMLDELSKLQATIAQRQRQLASSLHRRTEPSAGYVAESPSSQATQT